MKWWEKPLRISAIQYNDGENSYDILENTVVRGMFNTEQLFHLMAEGNRSFYKEELHGEELDRYLTEAHKNNIKEIIYLNIHCITQEDRTQHPEWVQTKRNGSELKAYNIEYFNCINGGWSDYYFKNIQLLCKHDIDGIFLDGPVMAQNGCYCKACQEKYFKIHGKSIFGASAEEMMLFKVDSVTEFIKKSYEKIKAINPEILLYLNNSALRADVTGNNTRKVAPYVDMLGAEGGFIWVDRKTTLWSADSMAKYIENQASDKPTVIFFAGDHKPHSYFMHTPAETKIVYAQSIANGAGVWYGIHGPTWMLKSPSGRAAMEMNTLHAENEQYYHKTKSCSKVALMWSMDSANYYSSSVGISDFTQLQQNVGTAGKKGNHSSAFMGFYEMLTRSHIQFDIIDEYNVKKESINKYDLIIMPTCGCMCEKTANGIRNYVKNGGNIISTYDTGFYSKKGQYIGDESLGDVFGIEAIENVVEYKISGTSYQRLKKDHWCAEGLSTVLLPAPTLAVRARQSQRAEVISEYLEPMAGRYVALPEESYPGVILNSYGKGISIYIAGALGEYYDDKTHPVLRQLIENIVRKFSSPLLNSDSTGSVEFVLRSQDIDENQKRYILHVINMTGDMGRPIEKITPVHDIHVTLNLDINVSNVSKIIGEGKVKFTQNGNNTEITILKLVDYDVLIIE